MDAAVRNDDETHPIEVAVEHAAARAGRRLVLAVSGGRDSMALLHAAAHAHAAGRLGQAPLVATFDHGTGAVATRAVGLVADEAAGLGLEVVIGHAPSPGRSEAEWRAARFEFLQDVASRTGARIATAHTRDDQVETVLMRVLRDAGARGLAGLYAPSGVIRPLLEFRRDEVADFAERAGARWIEDPTNSSMRFLRNRVRRDLLPALTQVSPKLRDDLLQLARGAAEWRDELDRFVDKTAWLDADGEVTRVAVSELATYSRAELAILWPAIAARVGLAMDWRGTVRASAFTKEGRAGSRIQLSGGWEIHRTRTHFELLRWRRT